MRTERSSLSLRGRVERALRMATYGACVSMALALVAARNVRAQVSETSQQTSSVLTHLPELGSGLTRLRINGESLHVAAGVVGAPVEEVARKIEGTCHADVDGMPSPSPRLAHGSKSPLLDALVNAMRVVTVRDGASTTIVCVAESAEARERSWSERFGAFAETRDLAAMGSLRQFTLTPVESGTRVIAAWLPAQFPVDRAFPETGDAPGDDARGVPRPEASRRVLTASAEGHPHVVRVYECPQSVRSAEGDAGEVLRRYEAALVAGGWRAHPESADERSGSTFYGLGDRDLLVQVRADARSGKVFVATLETRGPAQRTE